VPDCIFCRIASGQIPAEIVQEDSRTIAFRDINPQAPTHVLVIPKEHYVDLAAVAQASAEAGGLLEEMARLAHQVAVAEGIDRSGYRVVFNSGPDSGQEVPHVHAHILGGRHLGWPPG
jgi:histidine triad (HIT) family protein